MTAPPPGSREAAQNTDSELWREVPGDYYAASIHVTRQGAIGIDVGGTVHVMPVRDWHKLATLRAALAPPADGAGEVEEIRAKIEETGVLLAAGASLRAVHGEALYKACRTLLRLVSEERARRVEWQPIETAPVGESFLATCRVKNTKGDQWWETYVIRVDDETGEIDTDIDQPWSLEDYEFWQPLPTPPATNKDTQDE